MRGARPKVSDQEIDTSDLTLFDLNMYFEAPSVRGQLRPISGNEDSRLAPVLLWGIGDDSVLVRGESGSAKSEIIKATIALIFGDEGLEGLNPDVYLFDASSEQGQQNQDTVEDVKRCTHTYIPELQNAENQFWILKKWMEDEIAKRQRTTGGGDGRETIRLPPRPVLSSLAVGNEVMSKVPLEIVRRMSHAWTDSGKEINQAVQRRKAEVRYLPEDDIVTFEGEKLRALRAKVHKAMRENRKVINPYGPKVQEYLPKIFTVSNSFVDYFLDIIEAVTKYNMDNRYQTDEYIFSSLEDNWQVIHTFGSIFSDMCLGIDDVGRNLAKKFPLSQRQSWGGDDGLRAEVTEESNDHLSVGEVLILFKDMGKQRSKEAAEFVLNRLVSAGILEVEQMGRKKYYVRYVDLDDHRTIDWNEIEAEGKEWMEKYYSDHYEEWKSLNSYKTIIPTGPKRGEEHQILVRS